MIGPAGAVARTGARTGDNRPEPVQVDSPVSTSTNKPPNNRKRGDLSPSPERKRPRNASSANAISDASGYLAPTLSPASPVSPVSPVSPTNLTTSEKPSPPVSIPSSSRNGARSLAHDPPQYAPPAPSLTSVTKPAAAEQPAQAAHAQAAAAPAAPLRLRPQTAPEAQAAQPPHADAGAAAQPAQAAAAPAQAAQPDQATQARKRDADRAERLTTMVTLRSHALASMMTNESRYGCESFGVKAPSKFCEPPQVRKLFNAPDQVCPETISLALYYTQQWDSLIKGIELLVEHLKSDPGSSKSTKTLGDFIYHQHQAAYNQEKAAIAETHRIASMIDKLDRVSSIRINPYYGDRERVLLSIQKHLTALLKVTTDITDIQPEPTWKSAERHMQFEDSLQTSLKHYLGTNYRPPTPSQPSAMEEYTVAVKTRFEEAEGYLLALLSEIPSSRWNSVHHSGSTSRSFKDSKRTRQYTPGLSDSCRYQTLLVDEHNYQCKKLILSSHRELEIVNNEIKELHMKTQLQHVERLQVFGFPRADLNSGPFHRTTPENASPEFQNDNGRTFVYKKGKWALKKETGRTGGYVAKIATKDGSLPLYDNWNMAQSKPIIRIKLEKSNENGANENGTDGLDDAERVPLLAHIAQVKEEFLSQLAMIKERSLIWADVARV